MKKRNKEVDLAGLVEVVLLVIAVLPVIFDLLSDASHDATDDE